MLSGVAVSFAVGSMFLMTNLETEKLEVLKYDGLKEYTFLTKMSKHRFCSIYGIHTNHNSRKSSARSGLSGAAVYTKYPREGGYKLLCASG